MSDDRTAILKRLASKFTNRTMIVELTNACNLKCPLCSTGSAFNPKHKGMMHLDDYKKFLDQIAPLIDSVVFSGSGESLLHPHFFEFVEYTVQAKGKLATCLSNGTFATEPVRLVRSRLTRIQIDVNGLTQAEHARYRVGSDLEQVLENIRKLVRTRKTLRSAYPLVYMDVLLSRHNERDHDGFVRLGRQLGVNGVNFSGIDDGIFHTNDWQPRTAPFAPKPARARYECPYQQTLAGILSWDGEIQLCCMTPNFPEEIVKGNAFQTENLLEMLDSPAFLQLSRRSGYYPVCETCVFTTTTRYLTTLDFHLPMREVLRELKAEPSRTVKKLLKGVFASARAV